MQPFGASRGGRRPRAAAGVGGVVVAFGLVVRLGRGLAFLYCTAHESSGTRVIPHPTSPLEGRGMSRQPGPLTLPFRDFRRQ